jgi:glycosyltransferase involved in cell wall biosynthesis
MKKANKFLLCTYYWPPSGGAGVQRSLKFAKYLKYFDIETFILTVDENSATYPIIDRSLNEEIDKNLKVVKTESLEPFSIYSKLKKEKEIPRSGFANEQKPNFSEKIMRFIRGNFFLPDARKGWNRYAIKAARKLIQEEGLEAILTSSPPHSTQLIGLRLKKEFGLPWIADLRDPWTDIYYYKDLYTTSLARIIDRNYERKVLENADKILVVSESIKNLFLKKWSKLEAEKIIVLPNGYDSEDFKDKPVIKNADFTLTYTGTIAKSYPIEIFAQACQDTFQRKKRAFKLRFIGSNGNDTIALFKKYHLLEHCELISHVDHETSIEYLKKSDALLLLIPDSKENKGILTGKLFEYLGSKKPILGIGPEDGDAAKIIRDCDAGEMFNSKALIELNQYLDRLYRQWESDTIPKSNERTQDYSRKNQSQILAQTIKQLIQD